MKKNYRFLTAVLLAGLFIFQLPQQAEGQSFKDRFSKSRNGNKVKPSSLANARMTAVPSLHQNSDIYDHNGTGWTLSSRGRYTYDAQGRPASTTVYDLANVPMYKDSAAYDVNGEEAFNGGYQWQNNAWQMNWGYRVMRTFNPAGKTTEAIHEEFTNGNWLNYYKIVYSYDAAGNPTEETYYEYVANNWELAEKMILGYTNPSNPPTSLTLQEYNNGVWENFERYINITWHDFAKFLPLTYEGQEWSGSAWVNMYKGNITYDAFGGSVNTEQEWDNGAWVNAYRFSEIYDNKFNFTGYLDEMWQNNAWVTDYESAHVLTYNPADQITERIYRYWDFNTSSLTDNRKEVYSNFRVLGTAKNLATLHVKVYPNPATDLVQVQVAGTEAVAAVLTDLTGRVVLSQQMLPAGNGQLNLGNLAKGTYLLKLETRNGMSLQKIVKQ